MTNKELQEVLKQFPDDMIVLISGSGWDLYDVSFRKFTVGEETIVNWKNETIKRYCFGWPSNALPKREAIVFE